MLWVARKVLSGEEEGEKGAKEMISIPVGESGPVDVKFGRLIGSREVRFELSCSVAEVNVRWAVSV